MNNEVTPYIFPNLAQHMQKPTTELEQARGMIKALNDDRAALIDTLARRMEISKRLAVAYKHLQQQYDELVSPGYELNLAEGSFTPVPQDILHSALVEMLTTYASEYEAIVTKHYTAYVKRMDDDARIAARWED